MSNRTGRAPPPRRPQGFALLEALVALLLAAFAILGIVKLQAYIAKGSGQSAARSEAVTLAQGRLEQLRAGIVSAAAFAALPAAQACGSVTGTNAVFTLCSVTSPMPDATLSARAVDLSVTWTDAQGAAQNLSLRGVLSWDDPLGQAIASVPPNRSVIAPVGVAKRGSGGYPGVPAGAMANADGTFVYKGRGKTELLDANGQVLLYLDAEGSTLPDFTTLSGRVYFDQNAGSNAVPAPEMTQVRLSSEGVCVQNPALLQTASGGSGASAWAYQSYAYTCYVGPGWYGNVGITLSSAVGGNAADATICVGDPQFNGGVSDSTLVSAHPVESGTRTYRGFRQVGAVALSTGVAGSRAYPQDGRPRPSAYPGSYGASPAQNHFNHHFLLTRITGNASCKSKMSGGVFLYNAGKYLCIDPHNATDPAVCPAVWPGFEAEVGVGGSLNYSLEVAVSGSGAVGSSVGGIACPGVCATSLPSGSTVTLTASPSAGQVFLGWGGACGGTQTSCTLAMDGVRAVTASFGAQAGAGPLTVTLAGTGAGSVSSDVGGIACGSACSAGFAAATVVTLTATPAAGSVFDGWSGAACAGSTSPTCVLTVDAAKAVTASFASAAPGSYTLAVTRTGTGSGTVTSSPAGIVCGSTCSAAFAAGSTVTLTASAGSGSAFGGWSGGGCSGTAATCTLSLNAAASVSAAFGPASCNTPVSGTLPSGSHQAPTVAPAGAGSCRKQAGANFSCTLSAPQGTTVTLSTQKSSGAPDPRTLAVTASCAAQTNVVFP